MKHHFVAPLKRKKANACSPWTRFYELWSLELAKIINGDEICHRGCNISENVTVFYTQCTLFFLFRGAPTPKAPLFFLDNCLYNKILSNLVHLNNEPDITIVLSVQGCVHLLF